VHVRFRKGLIPL